MSILIEHPTAEAVWQVVQQLPADEIERLKQLINAPEGETREEEEATWRTASARSAVRFFDDEETS